MNRVWGGLLLSWLIIFSFNEALHGEESKAVQLDRLVVTEKVITPRGDTFPPGTLESGRYINAGEALGEIPGVGLIRRGASATEPVLRGMNWERVATQVNHLPTYGACPARMDPPITYARAHAVAAVVIVKGIPSVALGPGGTGGRVILKTDYERDPEAPPGLEGWLRMAYDDAREGILGETGVQGGNRHLDFKAAVEGLDYNDYESAAGAVVPANQEGHSASVNLAYRPRENHRWWNSLSYVREDDIDYPSLPMNLEKTDYLTFNTGYRVDMPTGPLAQIDTHFGLMNVDHVMSNLGKPSRAKFRNRADTEANSQAGLVKLTWRLPNRMELATGADYYHLSRDARRSRLAVATNTQYLDDLWPDVSQWDLGTFAEVKMPLDDRWQLRMGGRIDRVDSKAADADDMSLQKKTIRQNFVRFYGPGAADTDRTETVGGGNILLEWAATDEALLHLGAGVSARTAGVTERYFAFAPAPGGFQIGNPTLDPEIKYEIEAGIETRHPWAVFSLTGYYHEVEDYIMAVALGREDVNGDGRPDLIRGFSNVDARLYGLEAALTLIPGPRWRVPMSLAFVRGKNTTDHRDLPEIPPLEGRAALRYTDTGDRPWWAQFGGRFVARQDQVDDTFPEDETAGFSVFHLRAGVVVNKRWHLETGIENLFDHHYNEHLTRETALPVGDLKAGEEVSAPGRSIYASLRLDF